MKKLIAKIYMAKVWCLIGALGLTLASCIEEGENEIEGKGTNFIRVIAAAEVDNDVPFQMNRSSAAFEAFPSTATFLEIRRDAVSSSALNEPVSITFAIDNTIVDQYNEYIDAYNEYVDLYNTDLDEDNDGFDELDELDHKEPLVILEEERYQIESTTINFAAGEFVKYVPMTLDPTGEGTSLGSMDFAALYGLGVKITSSPSNYKMTSEGDNVLVQIVVKNQYDGKYGLTIEQAGWSAFAPIADTEKDKPVAYGDDIFLITAGPTSVGIYNIYWGADFQPGITVPDAEGVYGFTAFGDASPIFNFDANGKLESIDNVYEGNARGRRFEINPAAAATDNVFDVDEKTVTLNFQLLQNGRPPLVVRWVLEYTASR